MTIVKKILDLAILTKITRQEVTEKLSILHFIRWINN